MEQEIQTYGKVSIIMPSYNTAKYIDETINSVLKQTYTEWELIIVDDCSTDETDAIVSKYLTDERIKYLKNEVNSGAAITRNRALREATGKWIAFLDSDDLWQPEKLERQLKFMVENDYKFSYTKYERIDEEDNSLNVLISGPKAVTKTKMYRYCYVGCLTVMYDAEAIGVVQIKNIKKRNDYAIWLQVCKKATCYLLDENFAKYRIRKKSVSHDKFTKKLKSQYELFRICDDKSRIVSVFCVVRNMFFGFLKKLKYEVRFGDIE